MYSVPYDLIGEKVNLRLTSHAVEVFFRGSRVAMHVRNKVFRRDPVVKPVTQRNIIFFILQI